MANLTVRDSASGMPPMIRGAPACVSKRASIAASLAGWYCATLRALKSPLMGCNTAVTIASAKASVRPEQ